MASLTLLGTMETMIPVSEWRTPAIDRALAEANRTDRFLASTVQPGDKLLLASFLAKPTSSKTHKWTQAIRAKHLLEQGSATLDGKAILVKPQATETYAFNPVHFVQHTMSPTKRWMIFAAATRPANPQDDDTWKIVTRSSDDDASPIAHFRMWQQGPKPQQQPSLAS